MLGELQHKRHVATIKKRMNQYIYALRVGKITIAFGLYGYRLCCVCRTVADRLKCAATCYITREKEGGPCCYNKLKEYIDRKDVGDALCKKGKILFKTQIKRYKRILKETTNDD